MFSSPRSVSIFVLTSFIYMMWLLQFLIICESCCIILLVFVKVACPMKTNVSHIVWSHIKICIFSWKGLYLLKQFQYIMQLFCGDVLRFVCLRGMYQSNRFFWPTPRCTFEINFRQIVIHVPLCSSDCPIVCNLLHLFLFFLFDAQKIGGP